MSNATFETGNSAAPASKNSNHCGGQEKAALPSPRRSSELPRLE